MKPNPNHILAKLLANRLGRSADRLELAPRIRAIGNKLPSLTESERKSIFKEWNPIGKDLLNLDYWRFYKAVSGEPVNPMFVPDNIYWSKIIRALNPISLTRTYINKNLYPIIFKGLPQPLPLVNVINGVLHDGEMNRITIDRAVDILSKYEDDAIIKPTTATSGGHGVLKIKADATKAEIKHILESYGDNYICQAIVRQSKSMAAFNKSSLNTFRVNTVNINGKTSCECLMMRHGLEGSVVDNFAAGGIVCGMSVDGTFNGVNYNSALARVTMLQDRTPYSSLSVPNVSRVIHCAIEAHQRYMPHIGHAAWDFAIDDNEQPVMIEVNLMLPGIMLEQLTSGNSIFGTRNEEVIEYAGNKNVAWTEYVGGWE